MVENVRGKFDMLERMVLELGTELYALKGQAAKTQATHESFLAIIKGLKQLLDEKGLITLEDFDAAVELGQALEAFNAQAGLGAAAEPEKVKKSGH
jgi:hypothetical protein